MQVKSKRRLEARLENEYARITRKDLRVLLKTLPPTGEQEEAPSRTPIFPRSQSTSSLLDDFSPPLALDDHALRERDQNIPLVPTPITPRENPPAVKDENDEIGTCQDDGTPVQYFERTPRSGFTLVLEEATPNPLRIQNPQHEAATSTHASPSHLAHKDKRLALDSDNESLLRYALPTPVPQPIQIEQQPPADLMASFAQILKSELDPFKA